MEDVSSDHEQLNDLNNSGSNAEILLTETSHKNKKQCITKGDTFEPEKNSTDSTTENVNNSIEHNNQLSPPVDEQDIGFEKLTMVTVEDNSKNKLPELFAYGPKNKKVCYCQIYDKGQLCSLTIEFESDTYPSQVDSARCTAHVEREHGHVAHSSDPEQYLKVENTLDTKPKRRSFTSNKTSMLDNTEMESTEIDNVQIEPVVKYTPLEYGILDLVLGGHTLNQLQSKRTMEVIRMVSNREHSPTSINQIATDLTVNLS